MKLTPACISPFLISGVFGGPLGRYARVVDSETASNTTYDFIIVGGGVAGLTVADRLTEDPNTSVLVVEYGPLDKGEDSVLIPGDFKLSPYIWPNISSTPQRGLNNSSYSLQMGQVVGGGSAVNAMFLLVSSAPDYNAWDRLGNSGWGWEGLLPYFKKSETFHRPEASYAEEHNITWDDSAHGFTGPLQSSYASFDYESNANFWSAAVASGISQPRDANAGDGTGVFRLRRAIDPVNKTRSYARIVHYDRVKTSRPKYHLLPEHAVSRVLFDNKKAIGVEYVSPATGAIQTAKASKEVVLAAGAVHSPQILQLSGVGPQALLQKHGIEVVVDLPGVGQNLQDHLDLRIYYNFTSNIEPNTGSFITNATYNAEQRALYDRSREGAYTVTRGVGDIMIALPLKNATSNWESITALAKAQDPASLLPPDTHPSVIKGYAAQRELILKLYASDTSAIGSLSWNTGTQASIFTTRLLSRGSVAINSSRILADPLVDFGALTDPTDIELVLALVRKNREVMSQPSIRVLGPTETSPGAHLTSDEDLKAAIRSLTQPTNGHLCCTLAMAQLELGGVVDDHLRVYNVDGLSVADASLFPLAPGNSPMATVYAAAEKAADLIKKRHCLPL